MNLTISRCFVLFLVLAAAFPAAPDAAFSEAYEDGLERYQDGDFRGAVSVLESDPRRDPNDELLLGLAQLRLDDPARAAEAWGKFIQGSGDRRLAGEVARLRTIVVREANRRAARAAVAAGEGGRRAVSSDVVAVLPFRNVGAADYQPLGKAIAAMLTHSLAAVPTSQVVGRARVEAFLEAAADDGTRAETKLARRVGTLLGAGMVVVGAHVDTSSVPLTLEVDSALIDTKTGQRMEAGSFLAPLDRFYVSVRDTAVSLSNRLGWPVSSLPAESARRVQALHTESLEAALAFGRGLGLEDRGDFDGARREYERAVRADSSFELARRQLAMLPASSMSLPAVAVAVQSELTEIEPPAAVAVAAPPVVADGAVDATRAPVKPAPAPEAEPARDEEETTILGMSPLTAGLVGGGLAVAIGAGAALAGGGGGGDGGGGNNPDPPTLSGVENRTVSAGDLIVLDVEGRDPEGSTVTLSETGAPSAATFDTTRGNPATGLFRWQTTLSDGGQTVEVTFTATASRGPPNDTANASASLNVLAAPPTPTPPPMCGGTGASCTTQSQCCQDIPRECDDTPAGGGTRCCLGLTTQCQVDGDCCGSDNACQTQRCCAPLGVSCTAAGDCCDGGAACSAGSCCLPDGLSCSNDSDCCSGPCTGGVCSGTPPPTPTPAPSPSPSPSCQVLGETCDNTLQCCAGECAITPASPQTLCCSPLGEACDDVSTCCGAQTVCDGTCCRPIGSQCTTAAECCGFGAGCVLGRCCAAPGAGCSVDADCCAGSCVGGTCSTTLVAGGTPRPSPSPTPTPSPTPSPTPTFALTR